MIEKSIVSESRHICKVKISITARKNDIITVMVKEGKSREPYAIARRVVKWGLIGSAVLVVGFIVLVAILIIRNQRAAEAARLAEQARLVADPVTVSGIYNALNKERIGAGAPALSTLANLTTAAEQQCNDMVVGLYYDYTNPATGKTSNSRIADNAGDLYFKNWVSSIFKAYPATETATDAVNAAIVSQAEYLNSPLYNSVGWAVCQSQTTSEEKYVVGMFADKQDKPVAPAVKYVPTPTYTPYVPTTTHCYTNYNTLGASTTCY